MNRLVKHHATLWPFLILSMYSQQNNCVFSDNLIWTCLATGAVCMYVCPGCPV